MTSWILILLPTVSQPMNASWTLWRPRQHPFQLAALLQSYSMLPAFSCANATYQLGPSIGYCHIGSNKSSLNLQHWEVWWNCSSTVKSADIILKQRASEIPPAMRWDANIRLRWNFFPQGRIEQNIAFLLCYRAQKQVYSSSRSRAYLSYTHSPNYLSHSIRCNPTLSRCDAIPPLVSLLAKLDEDLPESPRKRRNTRLQSMRNSYSEEDALTILTSFFYPIAHTVHEESTSGSHLKSKPLGRLTFPYGKLGAVELRTRKRQLMEPFTFCFHQAKEQLIQYHVHPGSSASTTKQQLDQYLGWINRLILLQQTHTNLLFFKLSYCQAGLHNNKEIPALPVLLWIQSKYASLSRMAASLDTPECYVLLARSVQARPGKGASIHQAKISKLMIRTMLSYLYFRGSILDQLENLLQNLYQRKVYHPDSLLQKAHLALLPLDDRHPTLWRKTFPLIRYLDASSEIVYTEKVLLDHYRDFVQLFTKFCERKITQIDRFLFGY